MDIEEAIWKGASSQAGIEEAIRQRVASDPIRASRDVQEIARKAAAEKRASEIHRRRAKRAWKTVEEFTRNLEALGIEVIIEHKSPTPQGGASEHSSRSSHI